MRTQKDKNGEVLNIAPKFLLVPAALEDRALQMINSTAPFGADKNSGIFNPYHKLLDIIVDPRLDDISEKQWYMLSAQGTDTIEVAYLDGSDEPYLEQQEGFIVDGVAGKSVLMQVWQLWIIAVWSNQAGQIHYDNKAAPAAFLRVLPVGA